MVLLSGELLSLEEAGIRSLSSSSTVLLLVTTVLLFVTIVLEMFTVVTNYCSWAVKAVLPFSYLKYPDF